MGNDTAFSEGWGLFACDDGYTRIQRLDDPQSVSEDYPAEPVFANDDEAVAFVWAKADAGSEYHKRALAFHGQIIIGG